MTAKPTVLVATADPVEVHRWLVQGRAAGISIVVVNDARDTFAGALRELESLHTRVHKLNGELGFLTEKVSMMCQRLLDSLSKKELPP